MDWYDDALDLDPDTPLEARLKAVPARWAVYLMRDAGGRAVQLLNVRNLRASLRRRLGPTPEAERTKRADLNAVVRRVEWKRVDNPLESDLAYLDVARHVYPDGWRRIVTPRTAYWVHVDPDAPHPKWRVTEDPAPGCGQAFGPVAEKGQAQRLVERLEDLFDLCRYHNILVQAPHGQPCAYKDMGKCPAPCDGSVSMTQYRQLVAWAVRTLADPRAEVEEQTDRMREAAGETRFELAGRIKAFVDGLKSLTAAEYRYVRPAERFGFLGVQAAPGRGRAKLLHVTLGGVAEVLGLLDAPADVPAPAPPAPARVDADRLGLIASHLFGPKTAALFVPTDRATRATLAAAYKAAVKPAERPADDADEGVVKETAAPPAGSGLAPSPVVLDGRGLG